MIKMESNADRIDDETLIQLVKLNPILYDKSCKDYKNNELKKEIWKTIAAGYVGISGEDLENRFAQLRNQLTKKLREMKQKPLSGSGGGAKVTQWPLMGTMNFLIPHINPRRTRGSLLMQSMQSAQSNENLSIEVSTVLPVSTLSTSSSPSPSSCSSSTSGTNWLWNNEMISNVCESANDGAITNVGDTSFSKADCINFPEPLVKKKITPPPDTFHSSRKKKESNDMELMLVQSSTALQDVAKAVSSLMPAATEIEQKSNPYAGAIIAALEQVPVEKRWIAS